MIYNVNVSEPTIIKIQKKILSRSGIEKQELFQNSLQDFHDVDLIPDLPKSVDRILQAIRNEEKILLYGDYDVDGVTSVAILYKYLKFHNITPEWMLASRKYGYGVTRTHEIIDENPGLVIIMDCGTSEEETISKIRSHGIDVMIIDHHTVPRDPANHPAAYLINPKREDSQFSFKGLCSAALSWVLCWQTSEKLQISAPTNLLGLAAVGQISDMGEMRYQGRLITKLGLRELNRSSSIFKNLADGQKIDENTVGWKFGPLLNAPGRMGDPDLALELLLSQSPLEKESLLQEILRINSLRKEITKSGYEDAVEDVKASPYIVYASGYWEPGVSGIIASRLADLYQRSAFVTSFDGKTATGSARAYGGFSVFEILKDCQELLERFGGHFSAAGFRFQSSNEQKLIDDLLIWKPKKVSAKVIDQSPIEISISDITIPMIRSVSRLGPFGIEFPRPVFKTTCIIDGFRTMGEERNHISMTSGNVRIIGWNFADEVREYKLRKGKQITIQGTLEIGNYNGSYPQMIISSISI